MTEQLPRPIFARDIQVGDRVRAEERLGDDIRTVTFMVSQVKPGLIDSLNSRYTTDGEWTLLARPEPEPVYEIGSRWLDPATGARYLLDDDGDYIRYRKGRRHSDSVLYADRTYTPQIFARLIPLDGV